jgi:hypothetical protein
MNTVTAFPRPIREIETAFIPLSDGTRLAATIRLPADAEADPVPAILEYLPYRRRDGTYERDQPNHAYFAGHGYAAVRVDMRGSGDSGGVLRDEYLPLEQDDAVEVIAWLGRQPWCSGAVGMIGISWGGFNGLQVAARRPPALKAVISLCSTDDRYADDIHAFGGAILNEKMSWGSRMFGMNAAPPDPAVVGDAWRTMWRERLDAATFWPATWVAHQHRDAYYAQGSVCEDWEAITCPVYAVGGWADAYTNAIPRLLANLRCPRKGLIGPWAHRFPNLATPGPRIGFLQECLRWYDHWLKGRDTGIMDEPMLRAWIEDPARPDPACQLRPGRWVAETHWPSPDIGTETRALAPGRLAEPNETVGASAMPVSSPLTAGAAAGKFCPYGGGVPDLPLDQRLEPSGSLVFDGAPLAADLTCLGAPMLDLLVSADRPQALLAATLCEVFPDGAAARVSYGLLNLAHRESHADPTPLVPGAAVRVRLKLNDIGHRFGTGNRLRVVISTAYWPLVWPSPELATVTIAAGESRLSLPVRADGPEDSTLAPFPAPESAPPARVTPLVPGRTRWTTTIDGVTGENVIARLFDDGTKRIEATGMEVSVLLEVIYRIHPHDPASARVETRGRRAYRRGDWSVEIATTSSMRCDRDAFHLEATLEAREGDEVVAARRFAHAIPRDCV